ncbi:hypothetical protein C3384_10625 [Klebsiella aerogenes]|nr:hypothetical protein AM407_21210 [Klebsiella aerogenes]POU58555.1 hypothetical protein C3384_10625 [Klebsiella aerogenes]QDK14858.1 hypothetical protein ES159_15445 [Klebsiella aerogenes]RNT22093.1 hypothetical protein B9Z99_000660 [Klebsiella aerogenes]RSW50162.1 hypothetical protein EGH44_12000 [Klebsiella aerogenes]
MRTETACVGGLKIPGGASAYRGYRTVQFGIMLRIDQLPVRIISFSSPLSIFRQLQCRPARF